MRFQFKKPYSLTFLIICIFSFLSCGKEEISPMMNSGIKVQKTNPVKIFVNYKAWFQTPEFSGSWGYHWTGEDQNPEIILPDGRRQIPSYYYPMSGLYDTKDPAIQEYQLLLMKYCGIDGVVLDWYGSHNISEYAETFRGVNSILQKLPEINLEFTIAYVDSSINKVVATTGKDTIEAAKADMIYLQNNYFNKSNYSTIDGFKLFMVQGPRTIKSEKNWTDILDVLPQRPAMLSWWTLSHIPGEKNSQGEFSWIDFNPNLTETKTIHSKNYRYKMGAIFSGYNVFKKFGGHHQGLDSLNHEQGALFLRTMSIANTYKAKMVQALSWNDYKAGTMIEPTIERGFDDLVALQKWSGVSYGIEELELIFEYYQKRKKHQNDATISDQLKIIYNHLINLNVEEARNQIKSIP